MLRPRADLGVPYAMLLYERFLGRPFAGRGFKLRREDMKKLLLATRGKVFTLSTLDRLVECSRLVEFKTR